MAEPRDPSDERDDPEPKRPAPRTRRRREPAKDRDRDRDRDDDRERHEKEGDDPRAHALILERRWVGSAKPSAELYTRALQQWHALAGAVSSPATNVSVGHES